MHLRVSLPLLGLFSLLACGANAPSSSESESDFTSSENGPDSGTEPDAAADGGPGFLVELDGFHFQDTTAYARRAGNLGGGGYNGVTWTPPTKYQLDERVTISLSVNGGSAYLATGDFPCQEETSSSRIPLGEAYFSVRNGESYNPIKGKCSVHITQATMGDDDSHRIVGYVDGTLEKYSTGTDVPVKVVFDLTYNN